MENNINRETAVETPRLIKYANETYSYDTTEETRDFQVLAIPQENQAVSTTQCRGNESEAMNDETTKPSVSVNVPISNEVRPKNNKRVMFSGEIEIKEPISYSQPIQKGSELPYAFSDINFSSHTSSPNIAANNKSRDIRYDSFKTWSGKLERQITMLRGKSPKPPPPAEDQNNITGNDRPLPVDRYFDALEGPELETLRDSEEILLPHDKQWPFLLRFPISSFGICLGVSSQAILWKILATAPSTHFLHISLKINLILWFIAIALVVSISTIYLLKIIFYFEAIRREYYHPIRVNFFFAPWIALLFLALGAPPLLVKEMHHSLWYILMVPILCLELKIYGQWMSGGQRRLSKVANPSNHLSVVGNFVGALLGASMGLKEGPIFFFAIGLAHYIVLFVTLYQRLPTNETLPKELHPVFFLFVAAPSVASMAWAKIQGSFDHGSRISYFVAMFLYFSLAVRVDFFRGFKFSLAWWAYTFPMTGAAIATIRYSEVVTNVGTKAMCVILSLISTFTVMLLFTSTVVHAFVLQDLFPNDMAIAISNKKDHHHHHHHHFNKWFHLGGHDGDHISNDIENFLRFANSNNNTDVEALVTNDKRNNVRVFPAMN